MPNPLPASFFQQPLIDPKSGKANYAFLKWLQNLEVKTGPTLTISKDGQIQPTAVINGRTEGISTTVSNVLTDGTFNSLDNVHNGQSYQRQPLFAGTAITVENGNFETSNNLPPEGWALQGNPVLSYETGNPQSGQRSLIITPSAQFDGILSTRKWQCQSGDAFRVLGFVFQASSGDAGVTINFYDKNNAQLLVLFASTTVLNAWTQVQATGVAPANAVYLRVSAAQLNATTRAVKFDNINASRLQTAFELTPINTAGTPTSTTGLCTQHGAGLTQIDVAGSTWQFGSGQVSYNAGSVDPGSLGTWYVYADDPAYSGGAVTYVATATPSTVNATNGRLFFGKITTAGGTATSSGGGSGGGGPVGKAALQ